MNKEIKKASSLLNEMETKRTATIAKAEAELKATDEKLKALRAALDKADSAEQYKTLLAEIRDNEAVKKFCGKKVAEAKANIMTAEEYKAITSECKKYYDSLKADTEKALLEEIEKMNKLISAADAEIAEMNEILKKATALNNNKAPMILTTRNIGLNRFEIRQYIDIYFKKIAAEAVGGSLD